MRPHFDLATGEAAVDMSEERPVLVVVRPHGRWIAHLADPETGNPVGISEDEYAMAEPNIPKELR